MSVLAVRQRGGTATQSPRVGWGIGAPSIPYPGRNSGRSRNTLTSHIRGYYTCVMTCATDAACWTERG